MSMTFFEKIKEKQDTKLSYLHKFYLRFKKDKNNIYCFFESKDDIYYYEQRISNRLFPKTIYFEDCGKRERVLEVYNTLKNKSKYNCGNLMYFIDKDFEDNSSINKDEVYITPCHSIENLYAHPITIKEILKIHMDDSEVKNVVEKYENLLKNYTEKFIYLNTVIACQIQDKYKNITLNLNDKESQILKNRIISDKLEVINSFDEISSYSKVKAILGFVEEIDILDLNNIKTVLEESKFKYLDFRGKYQFRFLLEFIKVLNNLSNEDLKLVKENEKIKKENPEAELKERKQSFWRRPFKLKLQISDNENYYMNLSTKAYTPDCFYEYIERFK